jgi:hypothetical protein
VHLVPFNEDSITVDTQPSQPVDDLPLEPVDPQCTPRKKGTLRKKLTPKKLQIQEATPSSLASPASNSRSKKKLQ